MNGRLDLRSIPSVLDEDDLPFVLGFAASPLPCLEVGGVQYRSCSIHHRIDIPLDPLWLRALVSCDAQTTFVSASCGPLLEEWWPILQRSAADPSRPLLSAAVAGSPVELTRGSVTLRVRLPRPTSEFPHTVALSALEGPIDEENMLVAGEVALAVAKVALLVFGEYRTLVPSVPDIDVFTEGGSLPLEDLLDVAKVAADAILWTVA